MQVALSTSSDRSTGRPFLHEMAVSHEQELKMNGSLEYCSSCPDEEASS
jgi:hypothetical protein